MGDEAEVEVETLCGDGEKEWDQLRAEAIGLLARERKGAEIT